MTGQASERAGGSQGRKVVSAFTVRRLSLYLRYLEMLSEEGRGTVSSRQLAEALGLTDAQVRKDLGSFGPFGRPGVGYDVAGLAQRLRGIFGTDKVTNVAVIGIGNLGEALLRYKGWRKKGFNVVAAFDSARAKIGRRIARVTVQAMDRLPEAVKSDRIRLAILAVPASAAQKAADECLRAGVEGILNFAPVTLSLPEAVAVVPVDLAVQLEQLSYLAGSPGRGEPARPGRGRRQS